MSYSFGGYDHGVDTSLFKSNELEVTTKFTRFEHEFEKMYNLGEKSWQHDQWLKIGYLTQRHFHCKTKPPYIRFYKFQAHK